MSRPDPAEKMAALGELAKGLVHEMNTPLAAICGNNDTIDTAFHKIAARLAAHAEMKDVAAMLSIVEDAVRTNRLACERLRGLLRSVRDFARLDDAEWKKIDIREPVETALTLLSHELKGRIQVMKDFGDVPLVECNPSQLHLVFLNILANAAQAIVGEGSVGIRTWKEDGFVRIAISDSGPGMTEDVQARLFEPGFTTKSERGGMGLGLSLCRRIIGEHQGQIEVHSQIGKGATFTITLPLIHSSERKSNG